MLMMMMVSVLPSQFAVVFSFACAFVLLLSLEGILCSAVLSGALASWACLEEVHTQLVLHAKQKKSRIVDVTRQSHTVQEDDKEKKKKQKEKKKKNSSRCP